MAKRSYSHGTPEQMLAAFESKLQELGGDVSACSTVSAASFVDTDGHFGEPGATITEQEIREYWDNEHLNDPSLSYYGEDGFDEWYRDTKQWLTPVKGAGGSLQTQEMYGVFRTGGSIGDNQGQSLIYDFSGFAGKLVSVFYTRDEAQSYAQFSNSRLSPGEKKHYNIKYRIKRIAKGDLNHPDVLDKLPTSDSICSSRADTDIYVETETDAESTSRFIHTLVGDVNAALEANSELDSWTWEEQEKDLVLTTIAGDSINEYAIPKADLTMDWDRISEDVDYIMSEVHSFEDDEVFDDARHSDDIECSQLIEGSKYKYWDEIAEQYLHEMQAVNIDISDKPAVLNELMNNFGFTQEEAEGLFIRINECASDLSQQDVTSSEGTLEGSQYELIRSKQVEDADGFMTDYTMYYDTENEQYVFVFGDNDRYRPEDGDFDYECESEDEAYEWFDSYNGFAEEDDDIYSAQSVTASEENIESWFNDASFDVISAGWTTGGEAIVILNNNAPDIEEAASDLTRCIQNNNYHVVDWNVNGSNVFIFEVIHNDEYAALSESDEYFTPGGDPEDEFGHY